MTPVRWQRLESLVSQALELLPNQRQDFVRTECGDDEELGREVLSLIDAYERAPTTTPQYAAMREVLGALETEYYLDRSLGKYHVEEFLGRGGMSTVYRARDTESGQVVALKIFASQLGSETTGTAEVDHPNVVKILGHASDSDVTYTVMEYVDGETAAQRLRRSPLPPRELIPVARQMAAGLAAAHRSGISHGDLKPANLMIDKNGRVKILDFGCSGGTADYLAPERVAGAPADPRSDVYSFGATLYEMATGERDFRAAERRRIAPVRLGAFIERCLDKDAQSRYADADALVAALDRMKPSSMLEAFRGRMNWRPVFAAGAIAAAVAACLAWVKYGAQETPPQFQLVTEDANLALGPALSPDGKTLAYAANRDGGVGLDIWVQKVPMGIPFRLTTDESDDFTPTFSPDSKWVVFGSDREGGGLYRVPASGGVEERIGPAGYRPRFSPDGRWISYTTIPPRTRNRGQSMTIYLLSASGGAPQEFHAEFPIVHSPVWSPDGRQILFSGRVRQDDQDTWWIAKLDGSAPVPVSAPSPDRAGGFIFRQHAMLPQCWLPDGRIVLQRHQGRRVELMAAPFSLQRSRFMGVPQVLNSGSDQSVDPACGPRGELAYSAMRRDLHFWSVSRDGTHTLRPLTRARGASSLPSLTADGKRLLYVTLGERQSSVKLYDLETGVDHTLEEFQPLNSWRRVSADGVRIASLDDFERGGTLRITDARDVPIQEFPNVNRPTDFSRDAKYVLAESADRPSGIVLHRAGASQGTPVLRHPTMKLRHARFSPDQRWILFSAQRDEEPHQSFVAPFQGDREIPVTAWQPASTVTAVNAEWSADGQWLYFLSEQDGHLCLWEQRLEANSKRPLGEARPIRHLHHMALSLRQIPQNRRALAVA
ncbi:MAG: serine/threonine-protein kinase, partial [Bryobacterales bacterium]|nr:serine/threonine-protein kinase [Bryobacterales bacterium]